MAGGKQIVIEVSKHKVKNMLTASILFTVFGIGLLFSQKTISGSFLYNSILTDIAAIVAVVFGIAGLYTAIPKMIIKGPVFVIDDAGITIHSPGITSPRIPWSDVSEVKLFQPRGRNPNKKPLIMLMLNNPDDFINRQAGFRQRILRIAYKKCGSPACISTVTLDCTTDELKSILEQKLQEHRAGQGVRYQ